jgi:hypothetical protein
MNAEWIAEFDEFLSCDVTLEHEILEIDETDDCESRETQDQTRGSKFLNQPESFFNDFREECSICCLCWEPFFTESQTRILFLEKKQVLVPFALPCLHVGHLYCLAKLLAMRCTQKCCGRCAAPIPEQLFGTL